jgi:hypothetical protein
MYHQIKSDLESGGRRAAGGGENPLLAGQCLLHFRGQRAIRVANGGEKDRPASSSSRYLPRLTRPGLLSPGRAGEGAKTEKTQSSEAL